MPHLSDALKVTMVVSRLAKTLADVKYPPRITMSALAMVTGQLLLYMSPDRETLMRNFGRYVVQLRAAIEPPEPDMKPSVARRAGVSGEQSGEANKEVGEANKKEH